MRVKTKIIKKKKRAAFSILPKSKGKHFAFVAFKVYQ
jgi:hypothetical protein